ncbi:hypothetical protein DPSP01_002529 [Paraphaeosphaeria sporulosa]
MVEVYLPAAACETAQGKAVLLYLEWIATDLHVPLADKVDMIEIYRGLRALIDSIQNERNLERKIMRIEDKLLGLAHAGVLFEDRRTKFKKLEEKDHQTYRHSETLRKLVLTDCPIIYTISDG